MVTERPALHGGGGSRLKGGARWAGSREALRVALPGIVAAAVCLALYVPTLMPDIGFWDTAEFQAIGPVLGIAHPTGYPSYTVLAWLASVVLQPLGTEAYRANMLSALLMASAAGLLAVAVTSITRRRALGLAAGVLLGLATTVWANALRADAHALHLALVALLLVLLLEWARRERIGDGTGRGDRWLLGAAVVYGIALGNHALTLLLAPGIAAFLLLVAPRLIQRRRFVAACAAAMVITTVALYLYLPIRSAMDPPLDYADPQAWVTYGPDGAVVGGFRYLVLGEQFRGTFSPLPSLVEGARIVWQQLWLDLGPVAVLALAGVGVAALRRGREAVLLGLWFVATWLFALGYQNAAIDRYYLVPLMVAVVFAMLLASEVLRWLERIVVAPAVRRVLPVAMALGLLVPTLLSLPGTYASVDASGDRTARAWLDATFEALEPDAVIVSWWSYSTPMWYGQFVEGRRPDILVMDDRTILDAGLRDVHGAIERYLGERPVYVIRLPHDLDEIGARHRLVPVEGLPGGDIWRVLPPEVGYDRRVIEAPRAAEPLVSARPIVRS